MEIFDAVAFLCGLYRPADSDNSLALQPLDPTPQAMPEPFKPYAVDMTSGNVRYLDDAELAEWEQSLELAGIMAPSVDDWESAIEPGEPCARCGSLAAWWPIQGDVRCLACDPPRRSRMVQERVARIRGVIR